MLDGSVKIKENGDGGQIVPQGSVLFYLSASLSDRVLRGLGVGNFEYVLEF